MNDQAPNTLFDRLVTRAAVPFTEITVPLEPVFERWGEDVSESVAPVRHNLPPGREEIRAALPEAALGSPVAETTCPLPMPPGLAPEETAPARFLPVPENQTDTPLETSLAVPKPQNPPAAAPEPVRLHTAVQRLEVERVRVERSNSLNTPPMRSATVASPTTVELLRESTAPAIAEPGLSAIRPPARSVVSAPPRRRFEEHALLVVQPDLPLMIPDPRHEPQNAPAVAPEPVIHVTIGRLEIRSSEKEKPTKPREKMSGGQSLEQYLAKRREGAS